MASLKDLRSRITSVKSTQKITSAMKMVAASRLRRAQDTAEAARPYTQRMERMLGNLAASTAGMAGASPLLGGTGKDNVHLIVAMTANRGLCGGFNGSIIRATRALVRELEAQGKTVKLLCIGKKGRDGLKREFPKQIIDGIADQSSKAIGFSEADRFSRLILEMFQAGEFDVCTLVYNRFQSAISQVVTRQQIIPFGVSAASAPGNDNERTAGPKAIYEYEPSEEEILADLLPKNVAIQVFRGMLESFASEQGARMTAMDNATRNAGDMIKKLSLTYNRTRQAQITKELIEIISGAEAI
ncbi:F0F1 ATP synthase subunit gamma [Rhodospirillum rubrum]|uniref:F0F1 ATP synthase subunit gamma n=1 Tax=Rhodospirillum rubrum TaxID=1085 RepID=UPI001904C57B|nr:F0F1 ATP synthase subunit gamma [Rhodospirillum rubrum]MBK1665650.1 F0F1 ATP synthase subunit gamma [Rhodospirillum rubrum]MBK1676369.1 F0F1 ATP synthase subunit gamma [Rhodospirillum rubrum]